MSFLNSLFNNLQDVDELFENDISSAKQFKKISDVFNFNNRRCDCCKCVDSDSYVDYNKNCGNIGDKYICYYEYLDSLEEKDDEEESDYCKCKCAYKTNGDNIFILDDEQLEKVINYLKNKNIYPECSDFNYSKKDINNLNMFCKNTNYTSFPSLFLEREFIFQNYKKYSDCMDNNIIDDKKNNMLIKIYNIDIVGLNMCIAIYNTYYRPNINIFRILSGFGSLQYTDGNTNEKPESPKFSNLFEEYYKLYNGF